MSAPPAHLLTHLGHLLTQAPPSFGIVDAHGLHDLDDVVGRTDRTRATLLDAGVSDRDRVVLHLGRSVEDVTSLFAILAVGAIVVPVGEETPTARVRQIQQDCGAAFSLDTAGVVTPFEDGAQRGPTSAPPDTALLIYTSGSSGVPKGVVCSHDSILAAASGIQARLDYRADDRVALVLPLAFDYGLYQVFLALLGGSTVVIYEAGASGPRLAGRLDEDAISVLPSLPALTQSLVSWAERRGRTLDGIRLLTSTGADFPAVLADQVRKALPHARVTPMYGLTECKRATIHSGDASETHSSGEPIPGCHIDIVDEGEPQRAGAVGEIVVRGTNVMSGYWPLDDRQLNERFSTGPDGERSVRTGDRGYVDGRGRLHVLGRTDDLFKRNGYRTSVGEIEDALHQVPGVELACVRPPTADTPFIAWFHGDLDAPTLRRLLHDRLEAFKVPEVLERLEDLPVTANGKVDRTRLAARLEETS